MITFTQLTKHYGKRLIISIPELTLPHGSYWIQGGNGSGKTTLIKILAGIIPFEGSLVLNSIDLKNSPLLYRHQVSYAEAEPVYPEFVTGLALIRFVQTIRKENNNNVQLLIENFGVKNFIQTPVGTYSSGMIKKLALLMAFIGTPKLILLDEPLITLEDAALSILFSTIKEKQAQGTSFILTSHQPLPENQVTLSRKLLVQNQTINYLNA
jgi:ABC-2 type transport system ATP-binding protein